MMNTIYAEDFASNYQRFVLDKQTQGEYSRKERLERVVLCLCKKLLETDYDTWLNDAFDSGNMQQLNNVIFQQTRYNFIGILSGSGYDHCISLWFVLDALACGDDSAVERRFPHELGITANGYPFIHQPYLNSDNEYISIADKKKWYLNGDEMIAQFVEDIM